MSLVSFEPDRIILEVPEGTTILEAAQKAGIRLESPCGGQGVCGKCRLLRTQISPVDALLIKKSVYTARHADEGYVLACQACITGDVTVTLGGEKKEDLKILEGGKTFSYDIRSAVRKTYRRDAGETLVYLLDTGNGTWKKAGAEAGNTEDKLYGLATDIGTTTLVVSLVDLATGQELSSASALNPQAHYAQDVLSRISFASSGDGLRTLYREVIGEINRLTDEVSGKAGIDPAYIYEEIFSGNTCMIHLATGTDPEGLGKYPYTPAIRGGCYLAAGQLGLGISPFGRVYLPPIISSFVGPDITSGVLVTRIAEAEGTTLLVDIGTNGEMVLAKDGGLVAASTAAGPAFEGMNIEFGMRAAEGAIEGFSLSAEGDPVIRTIGNATPVGICGSGLMDIVGELAAHGIIRPNGKFAKKSDLPAKSAAALDTVGGKTVYRLSDSVFLTQKDVRQVQLAKGAVRTGIEFLMKSQGIEAKDVDRVEIAGSFGYHLKTKSLLEIGLLPRAFEDRVTYVGNTSKTGGQAFLLNEAFRTAMEENVRKIRTIELSGFDDFQKVFVRSLGF